MTCSSLLQCGCIRALTAVLGKFVGVEWPRYRQLLEATTDEKKTLCLFPADFDVEDFDSQDTITQFISFSDDLIKSLVQVREEEKEA